MNATQSIISRYLAMIWVLLFCGLARATSYVDVYVIKDGQPYPSQGIVDVLDNGGYSWSKNALSDHVTFTASLLSSPDSTTIKLHLLSSYSETVDYWQQGSGDPAHLQTFNVFIAGGTTATVYCHLATSGSVIRHPVTSVDYPRANTSNGGTGDWGPRSMDGGTMRAYSGDFSERVVDLEVAGRGLDVVWARRYLSEESPDDTSGAGSVIGRGWDFSYGAWIENANDYNGYKKLYFGSGASAEFQWDAGAWDGTYDYYVGEGWPVIVRRNFSTSEIEVSFDSGIRWTFADEHPDVTGALVLSSIEDRNGNQVALGYNVSHQLTTITDTLGREYSVAYFSSGEKDGLIQSVTDFDGRVVTYDYYISTDTGGNSRDLKSVTYPAIAGVGSRTIEYTYSTDSDPELNGKLLTIEDGRGNTILTNQYGTSGLEHGRVIKQTRPYDGGSSIVNYAYDEVTDAYTPSVSGEAFVTIVNDGLGNVSEYFFNNLNQLILIREYNGRAANATIASTLTENRPSSPVRGGPLTFYPTKFTWNVHDFLLTTTDPKGMVTTYAYPTDQDTAPLKRGHATSVQRAFGGTTLTRSYTYTNPGNGLHLLDIATDEEGKQTNFDYSSVGNVTGIAYSGGATEGFTYNGSGQVATHTLPSTILDGGASDQRVDSYAYYTSGAHAGYLQSITVDSGGAELVHGFDYDGYGRMTSRTDPKGNAWGYAYNSNDEVVTATSPVSGNGVTTPYTTSYDHDGNGNVVEVTVKNVNDLDVTNADIVTTYDYDPMNRLTEIVRDSTGLDVTTQWVYDANGNAVTEFTPEYFGGDTDNIVETVYDERDAVFKTVRSNVLTTRYDVDANLNITGVLIAEGTTDEREYAYTYDGFSRLATALTPDNTLTTLTYTPRGQVASRVVTQGGSTLYSAAYTYDARGRLVTEKVGADGSGMRYTYTNASQVRTTIDPDNAITTYAYDGVYRLHTATDALGNKQTNAYDANSNVLTATQYDVNGAGGSNQTLTTTYGYDNLDRVKSITDHASHVTGFTYDSRGNRIQTTDARNDYTRAIYDALSRLEGEDHYNSVGTLVASTSQSRDLNSRLESRTDPLSNATTYAYNSLDWLTSITYPDTGVVQFSDFDAVGNPKTITDPNGTVVDIEYDGMDRVVSRTTTTPAADVRPVTETFVYDGLSRPTAVASDSASSAFTYNLMSAIPTVTETQSVGPVTLNPVVHTYSHGGRAKTMAYPGGRAVEMHYNVAGQLNTINDGGATVADYDYIGGRVGRRVLGGAVRMTLAYTPATSVGHVTGVTHTKVSGGATLENWSLGWDAVFNKTVRNDVARSVPHGYSYDALDRLSNYTLDAAGNRAGAGYTVTGLHEYSASPYGNFGYDANGNLHELTSVSEEYIYDAQDRLVEHWVTGTTAHDDISTTIPANYTTLAGTWSASGGYLHETGASWGRILRSNVPADLSDFSFGYLPTHDPADPSHTFDPEYYALAMLRANEDPGTGEWTYLALVIEPNRLSLREWVDDAVTELDSAAVASAQDAWYRVKVTLGVGGAVSVYHGVQGGPLTEVLSGTTSITDPGDVGFGVGDHGDYWFDDVRLVSPTASATSVGVRYTYDALGRRVAETVFAPDGAAATTYFVYDGDRIVEEVDADGNVLASYVYGQYVDEVLQMRRGGSDYYYLHDDQYNVLGLTNASGTLVERYTYADFGDPTIYNASSQVLTESAVGNRYLFNGREWDAGLGLYHYRTRYMDPKLGRFVSRDTIGLWGDEANLGNPYTYLNNNPWSAVDPYGEQSGFLGFDASGRPIRQPSPLEMWEGVKEVYRTLVDEPVRRLDPNPGPFRAALESEVLFVDRSDDLDLIDNSNNAVYTGTQFGVTFVPITWLAKVGGLFRFGKEAHIALEGAQVVVDSRRGLRQGVEGTLNRLPAPASILGDAGRVGKKVIGDIPAITPPTNRGGLRAALGEPPASMANPQAQHDLPWTFRKWFAGEGRGLNVNDPAFGRWVSGTPPGSHQRWSAQFEAQWRQFIVDNPGATRQHVLDFMSGLRSDVRFQ